MTDMAEQERPIQPELTEAANAVAYLLDNMLNPDGRKKFGFAVLMFEFGEATPGKRMNYISNAERGEMLTAMKEFIAKCEGRHHEFNPMVKQ